MKPIRILLVALILTLFSCSQDQEMPSSSYNQEQLKQLARHITNNSNLKLVTSRGSDSMRPMIGPPGSVLLFEEVPRSELRKGDIFYGALNYGQGFSKIVVHRVVSVNPLKTKGLNNNHPDQFKEATVHGRVVFIGYPYE